MSTRRHFSAETIVVILILTVSNVWSLHKRQTTYSLVERDVSSSNIVNITNAETAINCAIICSHTEHCQAMRYDAATAECYTMSEIPKPTHDKKGKQREKIWEQVGSLSDEVEPSQADWNGKHMVRTIISSDFLDSYTVLNSGNVRVVVVIGKLKKHFLYFVSTGGSPFVKTVVQCLKDNALVRQVKINTAAIVGANRTMYILTVNKNAVVHNTRFTLANTLKDIAVINKTMFVGLRKSNHCYALDFITPRGALIRSVMLSLCSSLTWLSIHPEFLVQETNYTISAWSFNDQKLWSVNVDFNLGGMAINNVGDILVCSQNENKIMNLKLQDKEIKFIDVIQLKTNNKLIGGLSVDNAGRLYVGQISNSVNCTITVHELN